MTSIGLSTISCLFVGSKFDRFGNFLPLSVSILLIAISAIGMCSFREAVMFYSAVALFLPGLYLLLPYVLGLASQNDPSGRAANTIGVIALISQAIGPTLGGLIFAWGGPVGMGSIVGVVDALVLAIMSWIVLSAPHKSRQPA